MTGAALVALNTQQIDWSQQVRMYSLGTSLSLVSTWLLLRALRRRAPGRACAWYGLSAVLLSHTRYFGLLVLAAQFVYALGYVLRRLLGNPSVRSPLLPIVRNLSSTFVAIGLAWLPWLPSFLIHCRQTIEAFWIKAFTWQDPARVCFQMFAPYSREAPPSAAVVWTVCAACCAGAAAMLLFGRLGTRLIGLATVTTFTAALASSLNGRNLFVARYFIFAQALFLCGAAALMSTIPYRQLRTCTLAAAVVATAYLCVEHIERRRQSTERPGMMAAMAYLADVQEADESLVVPNPALQIRAAAHALRPDRIYVLSDDPSSFPFYSGRAVMRTDEYLPAASVANLAGRRLWVVDTGGRPNRLPDPWVDVDEESFPERSPADSRIVVHRYQRRPHRDAEPLSAGSRAGHSQRKRARSFNEAS